MELVDRNLNITVQSKINCSHTARRSQNRQQKSRIAQISGVCSIKSPGIEKSIVKGE